MNYTSDDLLRTAKRIHNTKRSYLLVNPLQAKHIPVSPRKSLGMMRTLGELLYGKYPEARLVIGFAETATAIGAAAAECFPDDCVYIHTTREDFPGNFICFSEEHSHAVEQKLFAEKLGDYIAKSKEIIFIDDEISTGKTLINIVEQLKSEIPGAVGKDFIAASIINRVSVENEARLLNAGIKTEYLLKLPFGNYEEAVKDISVNEAERPETASSGYTALDCPKIPNARTGVMAGDYKRAVREIMESAAENLALPEKADVLVLGTEECMYPAIILGEILEDAGAQVLCHSATRSPIGINTAENYPIKSGYKLASFYDGKRDTFIYNLSRHDYVIIVSDSRSGFKNGVEDLCAALGKAGCGDIYFLGV